MFTFDKFFLSSCNQYKSLRMKYLVKKILGEGDEEIKWEKNAYNFIHNMIMLQSQHCPYKAKKDY